MNTCTTQVTESLLSSVESEQSGGRKEEEGGKSSCQQFPELGIMEENRSLSRELMVRTSTQSQKQGGTQRAGVAGQMAWKHFQASVHAVFL